MCLVLYNSVPSGNITIKLARLITLRPHGFLSGKRRASHGWVFFGLYCGTTDHAWRSLYDSLDEAWERYTYITIGCFCDQESEEVEVFTDYGGGNSWTSKACGWVDFCVLMVEEENADTDNE